MLMLKATSTKQSPWYIVRSDDKRRARLNCIAHLLELIPYKRIHKNKVKRQSAPRRSALTTFRLRARPTSLLVEAPIVKPTLMPDTVNG